MILTGKVHPLTYRIILFSGSVSMAGLSGGMILITHQLRHSFRKMCHGNSIN